MEHLKQGDNIVLSVMEHHANIVPWHFLRERLGIELKWVNIDDRGNLDTQSVIDAIQKQVDEANSQVAQVQQIKKFVVLEKEWTDSSGELTPTLKLKRNVIAEMYNDEIESMYEEG